MLAIDQIVRRLRQGSPTILIGLALMVTGAVLDIFGLGAASHHGHAGFGGAHLAHVIAIAGMVLVIAGVVAHGIRSQRRAGAAATGGLDHDAHR